MTDIINLNWIPNFPIDYKLSKTKFVRMKKINNHNELILINILFLSSKCLKIYISINENLTILKIWLLNCIKYYNQNKLYNINFIFENTIIKNIQKISDICNINQNEISLNCIIQKIEIHKKIKTVCTSTNLDDFYTYYHHSSHSNQLINVSLIGVNCN